MGKKRHEEDYIEKIEKELRELKSVNRSLMRRLKKVDRHFKPSETLVEKERPDKKIKDIAPSNTCPKCSLNELKETKRGFRTFAECSCGFKELVK